MLLRYGRCFERKVKNRELCMIHRVSDPNILVFVKELESSKSMRMDQHWKSMLKKDYRHKIFTVEKLTKKKQIKENPENEDDIDELLDQAFGSDEEN